LSFHRAFIRDLYDATANKEGSMSNTLDCPSKPRLAFAERSMKAAEDTTFTVSGHSAASCVRIADAGDSGVVRDVWISSALRRVSEKKMRLLSRRHAQPVAGQIVVVRVEQIGKNSRLELPGGRAKTLYQGDVFAAVFGNRYATNQFEGYARAEGDACEMLSMGGLCGMVVSAHSSMKEPTKLRILGALADDDGKPLHLNEFAIKPVDYVGRPQVTVVCGTSMDSGKTHTAMSVVRGLVQAGRSVAAIKLTGTACCRDVWKVRDAGACEVYDFVDGGYASTYLCSTADLAAMFQCLYSHAASRCVQHVVVEIADGLLQRETAGLLGHRPFVNSVDAWLLAASDSLGAVGAIPVLRRSGIEPLAVSGLLTCSPLAMREVESATGLRCLTSEALINGVLNESLVAERDDAEVVA
jgi:hypothetical protein